VINPHYASDVRLRLSARVPRGAKKEPRRESVTHLSVQRVTPVVSRVSSGPVVPGLPGASTLLPAWILPRRQPPHRSP